ncbi:hypothetical protein FGB62_4g429 [Gracilaria domingensis]|nr:hypothetical protein FGB62_4g429 [Gracilaria domingensis]
MAFVAPLYRALFANHSTSLKLSTQQKRSVCNRQRPVATISIPDEASHAPNIDYDELVSDDTHVVLDSSQIGAVLEKLKANGRDSALDLDWEDFLTLAEEEVDEQSDEAQLEETQSEETQSEETPLKEAQLEEVQSEEAQSEEARSEEAQSKEAQPEEAQPEEAQSEEAQSEEARSRAKVIEEIERETSANGQVLGKGTMNYFTKENVSYMPRWLREMYDNGSYEELEKGAEEFCNKQRLHDIVARKKDLNPENVAKGDGIVDCSVGDVADDYSVPVEFVVDAMLAYGVPVPITQSTSVRNSMTTEEIQKLLKLITSFDAVDLAERYSDDSLAELADAYDIDVSRFVDVCEKEGLYLCRGEHTRLSLVRENRVLDILFKGADMGQPYPPLLQGLD